MNRFFSGLQWLVTLCVPVVLIGLTLRVILFPIFLRLEYHMPAFPRDEYGFRQEDRLRWSTYAWNYLVNNDGPSYLADLQFGSGAPVFNEREVSHMQDVKAVVRSTFDALYVAVAISIAAALFFWRAGRFADFLHGVRRGGWFTMGLAGAIAAIVALGMLADPQLFWAFFAGFHGLFFKGDTWLFAYSDTLIRLFPIRFWQDTFLIAALLVLGSGLALALGIRESPRPNLAGS